MDRSSETVFRESHDVDLLVVGGGINGTGIARDATGRGLSVLLCEKDDLASHTSSASTKLIHGGLRYLEQYEFSLVAKALAEREVLLRLAPHIIWPLHFVLPHESHLRPGWMIRLGLLLYDHLGPRDRVLQSSRAIDLRRDPAGAPLKPGFTRGFSYADAWVQDARLVVLNAMDAAARGAGVLTHTRCATLSAHDGLWLAQLRGSQGDTLVRARALVNATGPWAAQFAADMGLPLPVRPFRLVKGSHIVVPRWYGHDSAYLFQQDDRRIVFAIPYEGDFTLIGTTDVDVDASALQEPVIDEAETRYLCEAVNRYFSRSIHPSDVVWSYSGIRPLAGSRGTNAAAVSRDYQLELDTRSGAPVMHVLGGKLTTHRRLAEEAVDRLAESLGIKAGAWTELGAPLPGGDFANAGALVDALRAVRSWLPESMAWRLVRHYGTRSEQVLGTARSLAGLGAHFGSDLYEAEIEYLIANEWARHDDDILWRRTKLGLHLDRRERDRVAEHMAARGHA